MSVRLLAKLASYRLERLCVHLAQAHNQCRAAAEHLADLEHRAEHPLTPDAADAIALQPAWHVRMGEHIAEGKAALAETERERTAQRALVHAAYADKTRYTTLLAAARRRELDRRAKAEQQALDEVSQNRRRAR